MNRILAAIAFAFLVIAAPHVDAQPADPLPSWNDGVSKRQIETFVGNAVETGGKNYIAPDARIAVFDNDGTLWSEQPLPFQMMFAMDEVKALAPQHPEWKTTQPFKAVLDGDMATLAASGEKGMLQILVATHTGMTTEAFAARAAAWLTTARHPQSHKPYTALIYQPMLELLDYLRANGFKTYIVSGGTVEFIRAFAQTFYHIPPEQVIGSMFETKYTVAPNGAVSLMREPKIAFFDDGPGKPEAIENIIGRRPVFAFGNSDGDREMLEWTTAGDGPRFAGLVHHTDATREFAYDRKSKLGLLDKALDEASQKGWTVVDMKKEWRVVYPHDVSAVP